MDVNIKVALMALIISLVFTAIIMPVFIPVLHKLKFGQSIRIEGPKSHLSKQGTPTMGGIVFVVITILTMLVLKPNYFFSSSGLAILVVFLGFFAIGLVDDLLIVVKHKNDGLSPKLKILLQALITILLIFIYPGLLSDDKMTTISILAWQINLQQLYLVFALFMFIAYSNAVNLTDGLDGLSSITVAIALTFMGIIAYVQAQHVELTYIGALVGGLLGFYLFNRKPAKIFMGDTGSLALGGFYAIIALLLKVEMLSIIIGMIFVIEVLSDIIQIFYYKKTGKRFFRMAPIHHHFEMGKLKEKGTVLMFYGWGLIFGIIGMVIYFV